MDSQDTGRVLLRLVSGVIGSDTKRQTKTSKRKSNVTRLRTEVKRVCPQPPRGIAWDCVQPPSLESLPFEVLSLIFQTVQSTDLAKLAPLSADLYWPAVSRIYNSLVFFDKDMASHAVHTYKHWSVNFGTLAIDQSISHVIQSIKRNMVLGSFVHSINLNRSKNEVLIQNLLPLLNNLSSFHDLSGLCFPVNWAGKLASLTCGISQVPALTNQLTELRITSHNTPDESNRFRDLALDMIASGSHVCLKKLHFASEAIVYVSSGSDSGSDSDSDSIVQLAEPPSWVAFIKEFATSQVKLEVSSLGLRGVSRSQEKVVILALEAGVDLAELKTLVLNEEEERHSHFFNETFMEALTKLTPQLESLILYPTFDSAGCTASSICNMLEKILPHQLKELFISFFPKEFNQNALHSIQKTLVSFQSKLVRLTLEDGYVFDKQPLQTQRNEPRWDILERGHTDCHFLRMRRVYFPRKMDNFHSRPFMRPAHTKCILNRKPHIAHFLKGDRVWRSRKSFPALEQYYVNHLYVDLKQHGIFTNDQVILLSRTEEN